MLGLNPGTVFGVDDDPGGGHDGHCLTFRCHD
jgi:hypothetical protein